MLNIGVLIIIDSFVYFFFLRHQSIARLVLFAICGTALTGLGLAFVINGDFKNAYSQLATGLLLCVAAGILLTTSIIGMVKERKQK